MEEKWEPHVKRIRNVGTLLSIFAWIWLVMNTLAFLVVLGTTLFLRFLPKDGIDYLTGEYAGALKIPGVDTEAIKKIMEWDHQSFVDHFFLTLFLILFSMAYMMTTLILLLRIARAWSRGDVLADTAVRCFGILGWLYLIQGILGQAWGMIGQFVGNSNTCELIYFSFVRDTALYTFAFSGSGIEWGLLALAISWIMKQARQMREEQLLVI